MPLRPCQKDGKRGWKWGEAGTCYTGPDARKKALAQAVAIGDIGKEEVVAQTWKVGPFTLGRPDDQG